MNDRTSDRSTRLVTLECQGRIGRVFPQRPSTRLGPSGLVLAQDAVEGWSLPTAPFDGVYPERSRGVRLYEPHSALDAVEGWNLPTASSICVRRNMKQIGPSLGRASAFEAERAGVDAVHSHGVITVQEPYA